MKNVHVSLGDRSYDIRFGSTKTEFAKNFSKLFPHKPAVLIVTSKAVAKAGHARSLEKSLKGKVSAGHTVVLPNGEQHKHLKTVAKLYDEGFHVGLDRKSVVIGLGGGVITDMAGFFAATYMRGVAFVSLPTTILGMVDAAIGGKTGVDAPQGKNLIGAFWQPKLVWIDTAYLKTLPEREWRTGFAEVIKYGVIKDRKFFDWLERRIQSQPQFSKWPMTDVLNAIYISAKTKAAVVSGDEHETPLKGGREILNFGHTTGHALEAATGYKALSHGEAISIGMVVAGGLALERGMWSQIEQMRLLRILHKAGLPVELPSLSSKQWEQFWSALLKDKKNVNGALRFVLPRRMGAVEVCPVSLNKRSLS